MAERKRSRLYVGMRNYKFETHDKDGNRVSEITEAEWREKVSLELERQEAEELTYIFHDNDFEDEGERKALHVHFVVRTKNPLDYEPMRERFGCTERNFQKGRSEASALLYLTHTTPEAIKAKKTRYNVSELKVVLTEDGKRKHLEGDDLERWYRIKIAGRGAVVRVNTDEAVAEIIDKLALGQLQLSAVKPLLQEKFDPTTATMVWMKNKRYFKEAVSEYYELKYQQWLEKGRTFKLVYIEGASGVGKTVFARELARVANTSLGLTASRIHNAPNDSKGARYDFLNGYDQEAVTVFDDLEPSTFGYTEFLNLFERERVSKYSSRFNDKAWFAELAIITKSTSIDMWTKKLSYSEYQQARTFAERNNALYQPRRRFSLLVKIEMEKVTVSTYELIDRKTNEHVLKVLDTFDCSAYGFHDVQNEEFQKRVLDKIAVHLGLRQPSDAEVVALDEPVVSKQAENLKKELDE